MHAALPRTLLVVLGLGVASCGSVAVPPPQGPSYEPLAAALSPCGRYTLRLDHAEWRAEEHERPRLSLQMTCVTGDADVLVGGRPRVSDLVTAEGVEFHEKGLGGHGRADARFGGVLFHDLTVYRRADSVRRLRVECRLVRVLSWRRFDFTSSTAGDQQELICPPFHVGVGGDEETFHVSAFCTDDWRSFPAAQRDLFRLLGHDWVASSAELLDADGETLTNWGAHGSGGATVSMYGPSWYANADSPDAGTPRPLRYPVTGSLRLPDRYVVELVAFELLDVPLVRDE